MGGTQAWLEYVISEMPIRSFRSIDLWQTEEVLHCWHIGSLKPWEGMRCIKENGLIKEVGSIILKKW